MKAIDTLDVTTVRGCNAWMEFTCDLLLLLQADKKFVRCACYGKDIEDEGIQRRRTWDLLVPMIARGQKSHLRGV